jgi:competence ComEA-like helix-hairpin-helix protein
MPEPREAEAPGRERDRRALLFVAGLLVAAAVLASLHTRSITRRYSPAHAAERIDVNHASEEELAELPGVGVALAARIVRARHDDGRFRDVDDLIERVSGMGERAATQLAPRIAFGE